MAIVVDDSPHVWNKCEKHVVRIKPFVFFVDPPETSLAFEPKRRKTRESSSISNVEGTNVYYLKEATKDEFLNVTFGVVEKVHYEYYKWNDDIDRDCGVWAFFVIFHSTKFYINVRIF